MACLLRNPECFRNLEQWPKHLTNGYNKLKDTNLLQTLNLVELTQIEHSYFNGHEKCFALSQ